MPVQIHQRIRVHMLMLALLACIVRVENYKDEHYYDNDMVELFTKSSEEADIETYNLEQHMLTQHFIRLRQLHTPGHNFNSSELTNSTQTSRNTNQKEDRRQNSQNISLKTDQQPLLRATTTTKRGGSTRKTTKPSSTKKQSTLRLYSTRQTTVHYHYYYTTRRTTKPNPWQRGKTKPKETESTMMRDILIGGIIGGIVVIIATIVGIYYCVKTGCCRR